MRREIDKLQIRPETDHDQADIQDLLIRAFGPGRFAKTAERLREGNARWRGLGQVAVKDGTLVGTCGIWPVQSGALSLAMLGPIGVQPDCQEEGIGKALVREVVDACDSAEVFGIVCVGPLSYFAPFGFAVQDGVKLMPGPLDQRKLLVRGLRGSDLVLSDPISAPRGAKPT